MKSVEILALRYERVLQNRDRRLFTEFLVHGHQQTTLSSVPQSLREEVVFAKVCLGMLITLYDDLADNPVFYNPGLLKLIYRLNLGEVPLPPADLSLHEKRIYQLARELFLQLETSLRCFIHYVPLKDILVFDIKQIFLANQYAELTTAHPFMRNLTESKAQGPYNMGMVAAGMIDLMASPGFEMENLGATREMLVQGQRLGRIGNLLFTFEREKKEGDVTNEILLHGDGGKSLRREYALGIQNLYQLHEAMEGVI
jgi:hypothetical protein